jgi:iron-sulfur cluster repair protein YtfE (RIC family)
MALRLISQQMLLEHEVLARVSDALRTAIGWRQHGDRSRTLSSIRFLMESFQRHLDRMLEMEEHEGYMDVVQEQQLPYLPQIAEFRGEHNQFRTRLGELMDRTTDSLSEAEAEPLFSELTTLLEQIDGHNKKEMNLLQEIILHRVRPDQAEPTLPAAG